MEDKAGIQVYGDSGDTDVPPHLLSGFGIGGNLIKDLV